MNRRKFLLNSAAFAAGSATAELSTVAQEAPPGPSIPWLPPVAMHVGHDSGPPFQWRTGGLTFSFELPGNRLRFRHVLPHGVSAPEGLPESGEMSGLETSIHCTGEDIPDHHGAKFSGAYPGIRLRFAGKDEMTTPVGRQLVLTQVDETTDLRIMSVYASFANIPIVRRSTRVTNLGGRPLGIEYVSSAMLGNFAGPQTFGDDLKLHFAYNSWQAEAQWRSVRLADASLVQNGNFSVSGVSFSSTGSWPSQRYFAPGQARKHQARRHMVLADRAQRIVALGGCADRRQSTLCIHGRARRTARPRLEKPPAGRTSETVPVAIGCVSGGFEAAVAELTRYRRATHIYPRPDMRECPVVFNDVIALNGDQTCATEAPLIDAAAQAGCEVYCMDAGWCTRPGDSWWNAVGEWQPNAERFPGADFKNIVDSIRARGMLPGIWIEPEVAGIWTSMAKRPDSWYFMRHGRRVIDHSRYQLDFRNPEVCAYIDAVFARLVDEYGFSYIKLDYNINALEGTETQADSFGQGLLQHNCAFLMWLDGLMNRYPTLTLETVASGGMRMEHSLLSRAQLQSISDMDDYRAYSSIATGSSAALLPEQMGVWSQPREHEGPEAASCNMVNAMLGRIHQSGWITRLPSASLAQVKCGISVYKQHIRRFIPQSVPFYPLGMPDMTVPSQAAALGLRAPDKTFVAVWRRDGAAEVRLPAAFRNLRVLYPSDLGIRLEARPDQAIVNFPKPYMGCILTS